MPRCGKSPPFLGDHLGPEDSVQPLDWTDAAIHGMLLSRAPLATRFLYAYHCYQQVSNPFVPGLKDRCLVELSERPPRFVIEVDQKPVIRGVDTAAESSAVREFVSPRYGPALRGSGFVILERR